MVAEILSKLGFDWRVAFANLVNFLIIFYLLRNLVFKKLGSAIKERQEMVKKSVEDAERAEGALASAEVEKNEILKKALNESEKILEHTTIERGRIIDEAKVIGEQESEKIKVKTMRDLERYSDDMRQKMEHEYVDTVIQGLEKIATQKIDKKESERFAQSLLK